MQAKTADASEFLRTDEDYLGAIDDCLKEMKAIQREIKKLDVQFERAHSASKKKLAETRSILRGVDKSL